MKFHQTLSFQLTYQLEGHHVRDRLHDEHFLHVHVQIHHGRELHLLNDYDLLVTPTLACLPVDNADDGNTLGPSEINGEQVDPLIGWCLTYLLNFTGHPAASIPAGLSEEGLPVGMQIIGRRYADADVLSASAAYERLRPWQESYRQCAERVL